MKIDMAAHRELQEQGILSIQQHPSLPLLIHNYTQKCQWERLWSDITLQCRGLITDLQGNVVCRPFRKFFNLGEHTAPESKLPPINWKQEFYVSEKMDGSLGIVYPTPDGPRMATRGSFVSEQAIRGTEMLAKFPDLFMPGFTYLFEIIYPQNRIVLDYGDMESLVLLDIIETNTGRMLTRVQLERKAEHLGCRLVSHHDLTEEQLAAYSSDDTNREGVVVRFEDGTRIKIKLEEYCRLHKLITGLNAKHIWEYLRDGKSLDELIDRVPDEFMQWVKGIADGLRTEFRGIQSDARDLFRVTRDRLGEAERKDYAEVFKNYPSLSAILFLMLDERPFHEAIWKKLKPDGSACFAAADE